MAPVTPVTAAIGLGVMPLAVDEAGVPRLLRGGPTTPMMPASDVVTTARMHVERLAPAWGVTADVMPELRTLGDVGTPAGTVVQFRQVIEGLPVDRDAGGDIHVMVGGDGSLVAASGKLIASDAPRAKGIAYSFDDAEAVARAVSDFYQTAITPGSLALAQMASDGSRLLTGSTDQINVSLSRARQAWFPDGDKLTPSWIVEAYSSRLDSTDGDAYRTVLSADGRVLSRTNLKADAVFRYRVYAETTGELHPFDGPIADITPHPVGSPNTAAYPPYVTPNLVAVDGLNHPGGSATPDPWLTANRTETIGNNVEAYTDITAPDGLTFGDFRATITAPATFDRPFDPTKAATSSQGQQMSGIASLFYTINWLHDFWYDAGFTEAAGNAQNVNFNRGGEDRDAMNAEAQDNANGGSRNNANMSTPADGFPPRMQVFIWDGRDDRSLFVSRRKPATGPAAFGNKSFELIAQLVLADDGNTTNGSTTTDACTALTAPATGKIVLADRGTCSFKTKALNAQNAGAAALIIANNVVAANPPSLGDDATITTPITIGAMSVTQAEGDAEKNDLKAGPVTAQMHRNVDPDLEGTLDATVVAHEFAHYLHHRLTACNTTQCGGMSEGWGDFDSLFLMVRPGDNFNGAYAAATYSTQSFAADPTYFGIRRAPYSSDPNIDPRSFRHMANGVALPTGTPEHPFNANGAANAEVHNTGEVWTSIMWQGYSALLQQPGAVFEQVRRRMQQYVVGGLLMAPTDATYTETRDSILAVAHAINPAEHDLLANAYAQRGLGSCAISPPRNARDNVGIVESFEVKGRLAPGTPALASVAKCDADDVLDAGETGRVTVAVANPGPAALADVSVTLTSNTPGVFITRPTVTVGALAAYGTTNATFNVQLDDTVTGEIAGDFTVNVTTSNGCTSSVAVPLAIRLNTDDLAQSSATDTFDAGGTVWTAVNALAPTSAPLWTHERKTALDGFIVGADATTASDASLVSPPLTAGTGPVTITFSHRFQFEANATTAFDGGVIELSTDNGATFQDISTVANPGYNATISATATGNPLIGRPAFGNRNAANPNTDTVTLNLGTALAGKTFLLRFRVGSDNGTGGTGWEIDNIAFTGIVGTPFPTLVPDPGHCNALSPPQNGTGGDPGMPTEPGHGTGGSEDSTANAGGGCQAGGSGTGLGLGLGLLAVALRRRRR